MAIAMVRFSHVQQLPVSISKWNTAVTPSSLSGYHVGLLHRTSNIRCRSSGTRPFLCTAFSSSIERPILDESTILELPCLPFNANEVFIPTASKMLHLYEARFLALLEEAMARYSNFFAHIVIEPEPQDALSFVTKYGCLAHIDSVRRLDVGALVTIRGVGRVNLVKLTQLEPFLKANVIPVLDTASDQMEDIDVAVEELKLVLADVQRLQFKLRASKDELLQTPLESALRWAEKGAVHSVADTFLPSRAESFSFAALQPVSSASATELQALLLERMHAMEVMNTLERLQKVKKHAEQSRSSLSAKVALQSLKL